MGWRGSCTGIRAHRPPTDLENCKLGEAPGTLNMLEKESWSRGRAPPVERAPLLAGTVWALWPRAGPGKLVAAVSGMATQDVQNKQAPRTQIRARGTKGDLSPQDAPQKQQRTP